MNTNETISEQIRHELDRGMQRVIDEDEAANLTRLSLPHFRLLRRRGEGPAYVKLGARRIGYRVVDVFNWINARVVQPKAPTDEAA